MATQSTKSPVRKAFSLLEGLPFEYESGALDFSALTAAGLRLGAQEIVGSLRDPREAVTVGMARAIRLTRLSRRPVAERGSLIALWAKRQTEVASTLYVLNNSALGWQVASLTTDGGDVQGFTPVDPNTLRYESVYSSHGSLTCRHMFSLLNRVEVSDSSSQTDLTRSPVPYVAVPGLGA